MIGEGIGLDRGEEVVGQHEVVGIAPVVRDILPMEGRVGHVDPVLDSAIDGAEAVHLAPVDSVLDIAIAVPDIVVQLVRLVSKRMEFAISSTIVAGATCPWVESEE